MKRTWKIFLSILCAVCLTACQGYREIDSEYLISAICFDKSDNGFLVLSEVLAITSDEKKTDAKVFSAYGKTPYEAVNNIAAQLPRTAVFDHCGSAVISEKIREKDLKTVMKYLYDTKNLNLGIYLFVCKDIEKLLACKSQAISVGYDIMAVERNIEKTSGIDFKNKYYEIESRIAAYGGFCLPVAAVKDSRHVISGQTVFVDYNPVITLSKNRAMLYNLIYSGSGGGAISVSGKRCRVNSIKSSISEKGNKLYIKIDCKYRQKKDNQNAEIKSQVKKLLKLIKDTAALRPLGISDNANTVYVEVKGNEQE